MNRRAALAALLAGSLPLPAADRWTVRTLPAPKGSDWTLNDLRFSSPERGIAVGCLGRGSRCVASSALTSDGGRTWTVHPTPEVGFSLFFLDESTGWMTTAGAVFKTSDAGLRWTRLPSSEATTHASRVYFASQSTGWAVGPRKSAFATTNGGDTWTRITAAERVDTNPDNTSYDWITFAGNRSGMIAGASVPPRADSGEGARELPHLTIFVDTRDGGATWKATTTSMFGRVTRVAFADDGRGLGLIQFSGKFDYPSEVFRIDWKSGESARAFRDAAFAVTDLVFDANGNAILAGIGSRSQGLPGKVRLLRSRDLASWEEMSVAGRPEARRVILAPAGDAVWAATENGTLLRLNLL